MNDPSDQSRKCQLFPKPIQSQPNVKLVPVLQNNLRKPKPPEILSQEVTPKKCYLFVDLPFFQFVYLVPVK